MATKEDIEKIKKIVEDSVGTLLFLQEGDFNPAEKLLLFITATRTMARVILIGTSLNSYHYQEFLKRISFGYHFDLDKAIDYSIRFGGLLLKEIHFHEPRALCIADKESEDLNEELDFEPAR